MTYSLLFHMDLGFSRTLLIGRLVLLKDGELKDTFIATSGVPKHQDVESQNKRGAGCIPSSNDISERYTVSTNPINLKQVKGVEGNFYKINPHTVTTNQGVTRGDFGCHVDANAPGSAGCIVFSTQVGWNAFETWMRRIYSEGINQIPLVVSYSYS